MPALIGVALGSKRHPTGIAVVEETWREDQNRNPVDHYLVRHLERLPPGVSSPAVAERIGETVKALQARGEKWPDLYIDATGLGEPVVEPIARAVSRCRLRTVFFTHGDRRNEDGSVMTLGKAYLVARLQTLLQADQLHLPRTPQAETLARELLDYEIQLTEDANERYGAFRVGRNDDLVTALGLAVHKRRIRSVYPRMDR